MSTLVGVNVFDHIVPFTNSDNYPTHLAIYGKGGWRTVNSIAERDAIPIERREEGMVVHVIGQGDYKLVGGINNSNWVPLIQTGTPVSTGFVNDVGSSNLLSRADHVHNTELVNYSITSTIISTTTSTTYVVLPNSTINVGIPGDYLCIGSVMSTNSTSNASNRFQLRVNSTIVANTTVSLQRGTVTSPLVWSISVILSLISGDNVSIYWSVSSGTATRLGSYLNLIRIR